MSEDRKKSGKGRIVAVAIVVVAVLLIISIILLLLFPRRGGSSVSTGNVIEGPGGDVIDLDNKWSVSGSRFTVENMFPGDRETGLYYVEFKDGGISAVNFRAEIASESASLADVLMIAVTVDGAETALYDGLVAEMPTSLKTETANGVTQLTYEVAVYLDTSVGNEYQSDEISVDLDWWIDDSGYVGGIGGIVDSDRVSGGEGYKCCPWCFGMCPWCWIIPIIVLIIIAIIIILFIIFKKKKDQKPPIDPPDVPSSGVGAAAPPPPPPHAHGRAERNKLRYSKSYNETVSLDDLMRAYAPGQTVTLQSLQSKGLVSAKAKGYKVLIGEEHEMDRPLIIYATSFSAQAKAKILAAGGQTHKVE